MMKTKNIKSVNKTNVIFKKKNEAIQKMIN